MVLDQVVRVCARENITCELRVIAVVFRTQGMAAKQADKRRSSFLLTCLSVVVGYIHLAAAVVHAVSRGVEKQACGRDPLVGHQLRMLPRAKLAH